MKGNRRKFLEITSLAGLGLTGFGFTGVKKNPKPNTHYPQVGTAGDLRLLDWEPIPQLVVKETVVLKPKFPVIDIHNHLRNDETMAEYLKTMDEVGVWKVVSLNGRSADNYYIEHLKACREANKERLIVFFTPDFSRIDEPDFGKKEAEKLEHAVELGCRGLKIYKSLGLNLKDKSGKLIPVEIGRASCRERV